jgi:hypothetical protein
VAIWRFYTGLGVDPIEVGYGYSTTLIRTIGYISYVIATSTVVCIAFLILYGFIRYVGKKRSKRSQPGKSRARMSDRDFVTFIAIFSLIAGAAIPLVLGTMGVGSAAEAAREGRPILPYAGAASLGVPDLPIRADPVFIAPAGKPNDSPEVISLSKRNNLLYLGQANGTAVLYDPDQQRSIHVPTSEVILKISNCRTEAASDMRCQYTFTGV